MKNCKECKLRKLCPFKEEEERENLLSKRYKDGYYKIEEYEYEKCDYRIPLAKKINEMTKINLLCKSLFF